MANVLVIAPHSDDEVLGCGGSIAKHVAGGDCVYVFIVTRPLPLIFPPKLAEEIKKENREACSCLGVKECIFMGFPSTVLHSIQRYKLSDAFAKFIQELRPEIVYIPHRGDMHIDHKIVADTAMVALRPKHAHVVKKIYAYEVISETHWDAPNVINEFIPNVYNDISDYVDKKTEAFSCYKTQIFDFPNTRSLKALQALATFRGTTVGVPAAEAFVLIREIR